MCHLQDKISAVRSLICDVTRALNSGNSFPIDNTPVGFSVLKEGSKRSCVLRRHHVERSEITRKSSRSLASRLRCHVKRLNALHDFRDQRLRAYFSLATDSFPTCRKISALFATSVLTTVEMKGECEILSRHTQGM